MSTPNEDWCMIHSQDHGDCCYTLDYSDEACLPAPGICRYFAYDHLPERLQIVSLIFHHAAWRTVEETQRCAEQTVALRKLLEAKDAAVRSAL